MLSRNFDSVFSPILNEFRESAEDNSLISRKQINSRLKKLEDRFTKLIVDLGENEAFALAKKLKGADQEKIRKARWTVANQLQALLWELWNEGWKIGTQHGIQEVNLARKKARFGETVGLAEFRREKKTVKPSDAGPSVQLQDNAINQVVTNRTVSLANDVSDSTQNEIKGHLLAATDPKNPISERELENRIRYSIGRQKYKEQVASGTIPLRKDQKATERGLAARARKIAKTELSAAYSVARLQAYQVMGIRSVRWQFNEKPKSCRVCRSRAGSVHRIQDLMNAAGFRLRRFDIDPARRNEWGYDPSQYIIPAHPYCGCFWLPVLESEEGSIPGADDPRNRKPVPVNANWLKAGVVGLTGLYAMLTIANRFGSAGATAKKVIEAAGQIGQAVQDAAPLLAAGATVGPKVIVGRFDLNETSVTQLRARFGLGEQQAINLAVSIQNRKLESLEDLINRIERGEIPGVDQATLENKILSKIVNSSISVNNPISKTGLMMQFNAIGINSKVGEKVWNELQSGGSFASVDDMMNRLTSNQGIELSQKQQDLMRHYVQTLPVDEVGAGTTRRSTQPVSPPGALTDIRPNPPTRSPGEGSAEQPPAPTGRVPQALVSINQQMIAKTYRLGDLNQSVADAERSLANMERRIDDFGLVTGEIQANAETNQYEDIVLRIKPDAADRFPNNQPNAEDRQALEQLKEQYLRYANQLKTLTYQRNVLMTDLRDLRRQYNDIAQQTGYPPQYNAQFRRTDLIVSLLLDSFSETVEFSKNKFHSQENIMQVAHFARTVGARDRAPRRRRLMKIAGGVAGAGLLAGGDYLATKKMRGGRKLLGTTNPAAKKRYREVFGLSDDVPDEKFNAFIAQNRKDYNSMIVQERRKAISESLEGRTANSDRLDRIQELRQEHNLKGDDLYNWNSRDAKEWRGDPVGKSTQNRKYRKQAAVDVKNAANRMRRKGAYFMMGDLPIAVF